MNHLWNITIDEYFEIVAIAKKLGLKPGDSMEEIFIAYMKAKGRKPIGATELTKEELVKEYVSHKKKILSIETDKDGKSKFDIIE